MLVLIRTLQFNLSHQKVFSRLDTLINEWHSFSCFRTYTFIQIA